jgi:Asp-tRNA(Asn)/Glu-tRNA(Gln) amidotransferase A subunit family amidase
LVGDAIWRLHRTDGAPLLPSTGTGPLTGLTVAVKDVFEVEGFAMGAGNPVWLAEREVADRDSAAVAALRSAGAAVAGLAHTDEFAYSIAGRNAHWGTPPNGAAADRIPGGSSSGPASAVAAGQADIGLGTDTAGSVRVPASYQGLWGLRSTHGSTDAAGLLPLAPRFDTIGWLARDAATLRAAAVAGLGGEAGALRLAARFLSERSESKGAQRPDPRSLSEERSDESKGTFVIAPALTALADPVVAAAFESAVSEAVAAGRIQAPEPIDLPPADALFAAFRIPQAAEAWRSDGDWVTAHPGACAPDVAARFAFAASVTPEQEAAALAGLERLRVEIDAALGDRILLLPSAPTVAPRLDADADTLESVRMRTLSITAVAGITGRPAVSAPVLTVLDGTGDALPVGLCLVGPRASDLAIIDIAATSFAPVASIPS